MNNKYMTKKNLIIVAIIVAIIAIVIAAIVGWFFFNKRKNKQENNTTDSDKMAQEYVSKGETTSVKKSNISVDEVRKAIDENLSPDKTTDEKIANLNNI